MKKTVLITGGTGSLGKKLVEKLLVKNQVIIDAMNKLLILHADHEQNCSTSTVRIVGSAQSSIYPSISPAAIMLDNSPHEHPSLANFAIMSFSTKGGYCES